MKKINNNGYSTIISLLLIGFLLVLSIGVFRLILNEMKINSAMGDYIKSYVGAESSQELALLGIKKNGYGYIGEIKKTINNKSIVISDNPLDKSLFKQKKDVKIFFENDGKVDEYNGKVEPLGYDIIPLFYIDDTGDNGITNYSFDITQGTDSNVSWNIIGKENGLSGKGENTSGIKKYLDSSRGQFKYEPKNINEFLTESNTNYLIINNTNRTQDIEYRIKSLNSGEYFTKPVLNIVSSGEVGDYRQNLNTSLNNNEFLNILRYSVYSN